MTVRAIERDLAELCDRTPRNLPDLVATVRHYARASAHSAHVILIDRATGGWSVHARAASEPQITRERITVPIPRVYRMTASAARVELGRVLEDLLDELREGYHEGAQRMTRLS